jgi:hypothetical protein
MNKKQFLWICFLLDLVIILPVLTCDLFGRRDVAVGWLVVLGFVGSLLGLTALMIGAACVYERLGEKHLL